MNNTFTIARLTFRESSRRWILWVALVLGIAFLIVYAIGFNEIQKDLQRQGTSVPLLQYNEIYNFLTMAGLYAVNFLGIMMAVLTSVDTLSGEISSGTIHTLVSKPLGRWEIVLVKWLGFSTMLLLYLSLMAGGVLVLVYLIADYVPPNAIQGLVLIIFNAILLLGLSLLGGSILSTLANGVLVFGLSDKPDEASLPGPEQAQLFVGLIQAFVFGMLTMVFMAQATQGHGEEHAEAH